MESLPIIVEDTFDTSILEVDLSRQDRDYNNEVFYIKGGDKAGRVDLGAEARKVNYSETAAGLLIRADDIPLQDNGEYYPVYMITYFLKLKDGVNTEELAIRNGGTYKLKNTAKWGDHETDHSFEYTYDRLKKELIVSPTAEDHYASFRITFNTKKATLNQGEPITIKDTMNKHLSIDHSSVQIETDPAGAEAAYSFSGEKDEHGDQTGATIGTYIVPSTFI